jgi:hypothetical protein
LLVRNIVVKGTTYAANLDQPQAVIKAILGIVEETR